MAFVGIVYRMETKCFEKVTRLLTKSRYISRTSKVHSVSVLTVPLKSKLPPLVSFLSRRDSSLERRESCLVRQGSCLKRLSEAKIWNKLRAKND